MKPPLALLAYVYWQTHDLTQKHDCVAFAEINIMIENVIMTGIMKVLLHS